MFWGPDPEKRGTGGRVTRRAPPGGQATKHHGGADHLLGAIRGPARLGTARHSRGALNGAALTAARAQAWTAGLRSLSLPPNPTPVRAQPSEAAKASSPLSKPRGPRPAPRTPVNRPRL